jgi:hypothetical protein
MTIRKLPGSQIQEGTITVVQLSSSAFTIKSNTSLSVNANGVNFVNSATVQVVVEQGQEGSANVTFVGSGVSGIIYDGGLANTDFSVGLNINAGGVT